MNAKEIELQQHKNDTKRGSEVQKDLVIALISLQNGYIKKRPKNLSSLKKLANVP